MPFDRHVSSGNRLLAALPGKDRVRLVAGCEEVTLARADVLFEPGDRIRQVYFPDTAYVSLLAPMNNSACLEVALVGDEGMVGTPLALGVQTMSLQALVQGAGRSFRMDAVAFRLEMSRIPALRLLLDRYLFVRMTQLAQAAGCTRFHLVEARLARRLLMTQDRAHSASFYLTHDFLAKLLGVRRSAVTLAAMVLQAGGLIHYSRGSVSILDRPGLKVASCACYRIDRATHRNAMG